MPDLNSSRTRVVPVFNSLFDADPSGQTWLALLLGLANSQAPVDVGTVAPDAMRFLGDDEKPLPAPKSLLRWLITHLDVRPDPNARDANETSRRRGRLVDRDPDIIAEALRLLDGNPSGPAWYVLEGPSYPDVYIETDRAVIVVEGKRTEPVPTTSTTWMAERHQMLRHIDAAWDERGGRDVYGILIVEGTADGAVPEPWFSYPAALRDEAVLAASLPHRTDAERAAIARAFLGVTTWQQVSRRFGLPWPPRGAAD